MLGGRLPAECGIANARRIDGTGGRRELLRTSTRSAERQRIIEAEANRIAMLTRQRRAMGSAIGKHCSSSSCSLAMGKPFSWGIKRGIFSFVKENIPLCPAPLRVRRDYQFVLTNNFRHGMLGAIKALRKKPFLFTRSREGTDGASPRGTEKAALLSRAAEMPRRTLRYKGTKCPASNGEFRWNHGQCFVRPEPTAIGSGHFLSPEPNIERRNSP